MHTPVNQQQRVHRTLAPRVAPPALEDANFCADELCLFDTVLESYGLEIAPPRMEVGLAPVLQNDGTAVQWQPPCWQVHAQEMNMQEYSTQQSSDLHTPTQRMSIGEIPIQQMPIEQMPIQYTFAQQMPSQPMFAQDMSAQNLFDQDMFAQNGYAQYEYVQHTPPQGMPAQQMHIQQIPDQHIDMLAQYIPMQQTPLQYMPMEDMSVQQMHIADIYMQQPPMYQFPMEQMQSQDVQHQQFPLQQLPENAAPPQAAPARMSNALPPGFKLCMNCHAPFDTNRNHGMACFRHKHETPVVDDKDSGWSGWDEVIHGPKDHPRVREQFPNGFVWLCCQRPGTAPGCMSEEHVPDDNEEDVIEAIMEAVAWAAEAAETSKQGSNNDEQSGLQDVM